MQVSQSGPREQINLILGTFQESDLKVKQAVEKVEQIRSLVFGDPVLEKDRANIFDHVINTINTLQDKNIKEQCIRVLLREAPAALAIPEHELENYGQGLWVKISEERIKRLVIEGKGLPIVYEGRVLQQLLWKRPDPKTLSEMMALQFPNESELQESKAILLLCGSFFESHMEYCPSESTFKLPEDVPLCKQSFEGILQELKTGKRVLQQEEYETVSDYLDFHPLIPEGAFGPVEWEKCGIQIDEVPHVPELILNRENPENYLVVLIPGNVGLFKLIYRSGIKLQFTWRELKAEPCNQPTGRHYWVAIETKLLDKSFCKETRKEQLDMAAADGKHQAPSILEAVACIIASIITTGQGLWGMTDEGERCLTCCREATCLGEEMSDEERFVVGYSPPGIEVESYLFAAARIGVARLLREI